MAQPTYYPYGEPKTAGGIDRQRQFGTYVRDSTPSAQDYAMQRYYSNVVGRFYSPDPGGIATANPKNPGSWNRYAYVHGDPVNFTDPTGMCDEDYTDSLHVGGRLEDCYEGDGGGDGTDGNVGVTFSVTATDTSDEGTDDPDDNLVYDLGVVITVDVTSTPLTSNATGGPPCDGGWQDVTVAQGQQIIANAASFYNHAYGNGFVCTTLLCKAIRPFLPNFPEGPASGWGNHTGLSPLHGSTEPLHPGDIIRFPGHVGLINPGHVPPMISATGHGVKWTPISGTGWNFGPVVGYSRVQIPCDN
jgi:RHS repeat-associated protein